MGILCTSVTTLLVLVLLGAAAHKLVAVNRLASAAARLVGISAELGRVPSFSAFICEIAAAAAIVYPPTRPFGFAAAALLWATYAALSWRAMRMGDVFDCACSFTLSVPRDNRAPFMRATVLAGVAACAAFFPLDPDFETRALLAGAGIFGLLVAADGIVALPRKHGRAPE